MDLTIVLKHTALNATLLGLRVKVAYPTELAGTYRSILNSMSRVSNLMSNFYCLYGIDCSDD